MVGWIFIFYAWVDTFCSWKISGMKPITKTLGSCSVKIFHSPKVTPKKTYDGYEVRYFYRDAKCRKKFSKLSKAVAHADEILEKMNNGTIAAHSLTEGEWIDFAESRRLIGMRATQTDLAKFWLERHPTSITATTVADCVKEMMVFKEQDNLSDRWLESLEVRLKKFCQTFGAVNVDTLTSRQIDEWLRQVAAGARNRNNYRCTISTLFSFAKRRKYLPRDWHELEGAPKTKETPGEIKIFTPDEMRQMIDTATTLNVKTLLYFGGFAGMRTSEITRQDWSKVGGEFIEIMGQKGRTASRRLSPVLPVLSRLIKPIRKPEGRVNTILDMNHVPSQIVDASGVAWRANGLRHSYISYRVAMTKNTAQVALECGTSEKKIFSNYRALVTESDAREWFQVPKQSRKSK